LEKKKLPMRVPREGKNIKGFGGNVAGRD